MACSTKKNTWSRRTYHGITAHYNAYFNGMIAFKEGVEQIEKSHQDDFSKVLPMFKLGDEKTAANSFPKMDRAYKKASLAISRHSINIRGREYNKWIDDCYLLIGKAHFYKRDYKSAKITFNYIFNIMRSSPLATEAKIWHILADNQEKNFRRAEDMLAALEPKIKSSSTNKEMKALYAMTGADFFLKQEKYELAIPYLLNAIKYQRKKDKITRSMFILGQIYNRTDKKQEATKIFTQVIERNPEYELVFNATLNLAKAYQAGSLEDKKVLKKQLEKMLKDRKNEDFKDQIYFVMAEVAMKEQDTLQGIEYLKLSASSSVSNQRQKAMSFLTLADIYFSKQKYELAQSYYDSTMRSLPKEYEKYDEIKAKTESLTDLVTNLRTVQREDSLQDIASMSDEAIDQFLDDLIKKLKEEEDRKKKEAWEKQQMMNNMGDNSNDFMNMYETSGDWYFYNPSAMSFGLSEFQKKWGKRKLEDLWRLSNKQLVGGNIAFNEGQGEGSDTAAASNTIPGYSTVKTKEFYKKDLPLTDSMMEISNKRIEDAFYYLGVIYKEELENYKKADQTYKELLHRFPETKYKLPVYYQLYRIHIEMGNNSERDYYKNQIFREFPDSDYAKIIKNPDYYKILEKEKNKAENYYASLYVLYKDQQYEAIITNISKVDSLFEDSPVLPKFKYLNALAVGETKSRNEFEDALMEITKKYPKSEYATLAQNTLDFINKNKTSDTTASGKQNVENTSNSPYKFNPKALHLFIIVIEVKNTDMNDLKAKLSDFNNEFFSLNKLSISSIFFDNKNQMITISNFKSKEEGITYFNAFNNNDQLKAYLQPSKYSAFLVTTSNYSTFYKRKNIEEYQAFFKEHYLIEN